jgi:hypothetical protein
MKRKAGKRFYEEARKKGNQESKKIENRKTGTENFF